MGEMLHWIVKCFYSVLKRSKKEQVEEELIFQ